MITFPGLTCERCQLVPFSPEFLSERYVGWLNDPEVVRYSEQRHRHHTLASCREYYEQVRASGDLFIAILAATKSLGHVGNITVSFDHANRSADVSIMVGDAGARGTGIGRSAWCGIVEWLLSHGGMRRITAGTMAENGAMIALLHKSAMNIDAVRPRAFLLEDREVDLILASRFASVDRARS